MTYYDAQLQQLQQQIARLNHLNTVIPELRNQRSTLESRVRELKSVMLREQEDVERLEGGSLAAFFYNVIGKMDEHLTKERQEAYAAKVKYDIAFRELETVKTDLDRFTQELAGLRGCQQRYDAMLKEKAAAIKAVGGLASEKILKLEERSAFLNSYRKELQESIRAGKNALSTAEDVLDSLDSAEGWSKWDLLGGGGLISDMVKHSHLDSAQEDIQLLQSRLRLFQTELADVTIQADIQVTVEGALRFADYFFDGLFADWAVLDHIGHSQEQVERTKNQIEQVLSRLERAVK